jgi:hypothetical protein
MFSSLAAAEKIVNQDFVMVMTVGTKMVNDLIIFRLIMLVHHTVLLHRLITGVAKQEEPS